MSETFLSGDLSKWDIEAKHPDDYLVDQFHLDPIALPEIVQQIADGTANPPLAQAEVLDGLERSGATQAAALLRR